MKPSTNFLLPPCTHRGHNPGVGPSGKGQQSRGQVAHSAFQASFLSMQISIKQHAFSVRGPYSEGTRLTKAEAQALNGLRAENIRNNVFKLVMEALGTADPGQVLPASSHQELQEKITEYDLKYQFP